MPIIPYLYYEDVDRMLAWLAEAFGFKRYGIRMKGSDGKTEHAAMRTADGVFMMGRPPAALKYNNPRRIGQTTQSLCIDVMGDVDRHSRTQGRREPGSSRSQTTPSTVSAATESRTRKGTYGAFLGTSRRAPASSAERRCGRGIPASASIGAAEQPAAPAGGRGTRSAVTGDIRPPQVGASGGTKERIAMSALSQVGELSVAAGDGHRFVVAKRLKYETKSNAASLLTALLHHPAYRDTFLTPDSAQHDSVDMHGPFVLSDIRLEDFGPIDARSARQAIEAFWADEGYGLPKPGATEQIKQLIHELDLDHAKTLRLEKSGASQEHQLSHSLRGGFQEFIIINPEVHVVTLLVLGINQ